MEFENPNFGECELMNCDVKIGKTIIFIKKDTSNPYVVTSNLLRDKTWVKGEYFPTYEQAKIYYDKITGKEESIW